MAARWCFPTPLREPIGWPRVVEWGLGHGQPRYASLRPPLPLYSAARRGPTNHGTVGRPRSGRDPGATGPQPLGWASEIILTKGPGGIIRIFPKKGDIWALYQNWSPDWDQFTPDDMIYKYELVEVLDSYNPAKGISVMPIVKVPGFVSVFKPFHNATKSWRIPREEMMRFSHQVPFHVLTGEAHNAPKGCYELDPGSTPQELLHVVPPSGDAK